MWARGFVNDTVPFSSAVTFVPPRSAVIASVYFALPAPVVFARASLSEPVGVLRVASRRTQ